ncbi:tetratricopeptide repeat protein 19, mitochondrial [Aplysia californica]|uniref:Tetratricopeptide repeat protein 19, mitochondrial n=1 Tax=Aplysia californica TaxID=6500 RepID=A0ABM0J9Y3_APLCA|nr:tetratricopeptide repeat protein 19, mitochondrial [Aplysia californica]
MINNMATPMIRRLCMNFGRLTYPVLKSASTQRVLKCASTSIRNVCRSKVASATGTGLGISYALLGFSFGKKAEKESDPLTETYREARLAHVRQDLQRADELYHEALKLADDMLKTEQITADKHLTARTLMYDGLADIAMQTGQMEPAEALYKETMKGCFQQGLAQDHNVIIEISLKLASIYAMQGKKTEAEEGYKFCVAMQTPKMAAREKQWVDSDGKKKKVHKMDLSKEALAETEQDTAVLLGMSLGSYGRFLMYEKRYQEALPLFERARVYAKNTMGMDTNQYVVILNDIATLFIVTKNFDKAENVLKEGIDISEKAKLPEAAVLHCNMGALNLRRGEVTQAMKSCQQGLECAKKFDHKLAYRMAEACLKKGASVEAKSS